MTHCKYCGRNDHGLVDCWQKHDHKTIKQEFIRADHCLYCNHQDLDKKKPAVHTQEEKKYICISKRDGTKYERHAWVLCSDQLLPIPPNIVHEYVFMCPDCEVRKVANYAVSAV
jgi:hypothetical protein